MEIKTGLTADVSFGVSTSDHGDPDRSEVRPDDQNQPDEAELEDSDGSR